MIGADMGLRGYLPPSLEVVAALVAAAIEGEYPWWGVADALEERGETGLAGEARHLGRWAERYPLPLAGARLQKRTRRLARWARSILPQLPRLACETGSEGEEGESCLII